MTGPPGEHKDGPGSDQDAPEPVFEVVEDWLEESRASFLEPVPGLPVSMF